MRFARETMLVVVVVGTLLAGQADVEADRSALSLAIRQGERDTVAAILDRRPALATSSDAAGFTPLHIAATAGRVDMAELLLSRGAGLEARTPDGRTPLFQAIPLGSGEAFAYLLSRGANLHARDNAQGTILEFALTWRRPAMVELILRAGFRLDEVSRGEAALLDDAANTGVAALVDALAARRSAFDLSVREGTTLLHSAARGGLDDLTARLLAQRPDLDVRDLHGMTPLHVAAFHGHTAVVRRLLAAGAQPLVAGFDGRTAFALAVATGHADTAAALDASRADAPTAVFPRLSANYLDAPEPDDRARLFSPGIVSTEWHETNVSFAPDGRELCFTRIDTDQRRRRVFFMRRTADGWAAPSEAPFSGDGIDFECAYAPDGRRLFYVSDRDRVSTTARQRDTDIWASEREGASWSAPRNLGQAINSDSNEYMPSADRAGNLYFERYGLNTARASDGNFQPATPLHIENVTNAGHPFVDPDGQYLLFDGRLPDSSKSVLFVSFRTADGAWSPARRVFTTEPREYESCPSVSPDGRFLFFGRDHDIYWVSTGVIAAARAAR